MKILPKTKLAAICAYPLWMAQMAALYDGVNIKNGGQKATASFNRWRLRTVEGQKST